MSPPAGGPRIYALIFRLALTAFPAAFTGKHAGEMRTAFDEEIGRARARGGHPAMLGYALRATLDALRQGLRERLRRSPPPGHGRRAMPEGRPWSGLPEDLRLALRRIRRAPGFTLSAVAVLALGIGANATVFSALRMVLLEPPPYPEPERLAFVHLTQEHTGRGDSRITTWSYPKFTAFLQAENRLIAPVAGYTNRVGLLSEPAPTTRIDFEVVSPSYFKILGVEPAIGRTFADNEDNASDPPLVAVLSHDLWSSRFGGDPGVLGRDVTLNGERLTIVGVAPEGFRGLTGSARLWVPMAAADQTMGYAVLEQSGNHWFHAIGRLRADASLTEARAQTASIGEGISELYPSNDPQSRWSATARSFDEARVNEDARAAVTLLMVAAGLVLLVACANLSGLLLARSRRHTRDRAVRMAVGASRWRIVRGSLVESALLAVMGGTVGVGLAAWGTRAMAAAWPAEFLRSAQREMRVADPATLGLQPSVLTFAALVTLLTAILFGAGPALRLSGTDVSSTLKDAAGVTRREGTWMGLDVRTVLVSGQVALALMLLVGAGLMGSSIARLLNVDPGFRAEGLVTFGYAVPETSSWADRRLELHDELLARIGGMPSVEAVATGGPPLRGHWFQTRVDAIEGGREIPAGEGILIGGHMVSDDYFEALGTPLLAGRTFEPRDGQDRFPTIVISESAAEELFPGLDPVGARIRIGISDEGKDAWSEIIGVVGDVLYSPPDQPVLPEVYYSNREFGSVTSTVLVRTTEAETPLIPAIRELATELDPTLAIHGFTTGRDIVRASVGDRRILLVLLGLFAGVTVLLAATGTWGIVAVSVADRRRELGLRLALGAGAGRVVRMVLRQGVVAGVLGAAVGLAGAAAGSGLLEAFLWDTPRLDPRGYAGAALFLVGVVILSSWLPARAVLRLEPASTLNSE